MNLEDKAKEYAEQFRIKDAPVASDIEMTFAKRHYKAGFNAGQKGKDLETQIAYESGRDAERKEWIKFVKEILNTLDIWRATTKNKTALHWIDGIKKDCIIRHANQSGIELNELENLQK